MAMSVTTAERTNGSIKVAAFVWVSAADGTATGATTKAFDGQVLELITNPSATAPTDNYDITVTDADGYDVLNGQGANRDTANTELVVHSDTTPLGVVSGSVLTLNVAAAGNTKGGDVLVKIR
jgi:hypothetical protein